MNNVIFTHADNKNKYYQSKAKVVTDEGRLQSPKLFNTKVSMDYTFDFEGRGMTASDIVKLIKVVSNYIKPDSTLACYDSKSRRQKPMSKCDLQKALGFTKGSFYKFWARCTEANVFKLDKWISNNDVTCEAIFVNPIVMQSNFSITPLAYWLFKSDIDKKLDDTTIAMFTDEYYRQYGTHSHEDANNYLADTEESVIADHKRVLDELVLNGKAADIYHFGDKINTFFLANESVKSGKRRATDIKIYRNLFIDIDAGKDDEGNYYDLTEVAKRKEAMLEAIYNLPLVPTMITDTRNGYHCIWSIEPTEDGEAWQSAQDKLVSIFKIADKAVSDKARVLRLPDSTWKKGDYDPYEVTIHDSNYVRYDLDTFVKELEDSKDDINAACDNYLNKYPMTIKAVPDRKLKVESEDIDNQRIKDIAAAKTDILDNPKERTLTYSAFKRSVKRVDLSEFLNLPSHGLFRCIFHDDTNDSANIIGNKEKGFRYYCFNPECEGNGLNHGLDIINCVMILQGCKYQDAISYLAKVFNVKLIKTH